MTTTTPPKSSPSTPVKQGNSLSNHVSSSVSLKQPPKKCSLNENHCLSLGDILHSFSTPISEEHAWALTYQLAKCFANALRTDPKRCRIVRTLSEVFVHKDGHVHPTTIFRDDLSMDQNQVDGGSGPTEAEVVAGLGIVMFEALDFGMDEDEERHLSPEMSRLMAIMIPSQGREAVLDDPLEEEPPPEELDDEGIGTDSYFPEDEHQTTSLSRILKDCTVHLGCGGSQEADSHYRAVCRALVAEALELSTFLERVGTGEIRKETTDHLIKSDWARLWMQVVRELRRGVQLKKVCYTRKPIEFELTPYEILMEDIRSRRYKLNKVPSLDGGIPYNVKKDAHDVIMEFIRSRPPLKKASERKLKPLITDLGSLTPREQLLNAIKAGDVRLRPSPAHSPSESSGSSPSDEELAEVPVPSIEEEESSISSQPPPPSSRRPSLINWNLLNYQTLLVVFLGLVMTFIKGRIRQRFH